MWAPNFTLTLLKNSQNGWQNNKLFTTTLLEQNPTLDFCTVPDSEIKYSLPLTHLCPGKDYWADFNHFLHINPSDNQIKKIGEV